ncbi:MAG TPA: DUF4270 family protein, partial [Parafilimonas sp.]|nr:DUF4270 family protein [Parafilimonas sp.]
MIFAFFDCTKISNTDIGAGLIPPVDGVKTKDTVLDVITKNQAFDTVAVGFSDDHVLGYISNDPVFGTTSASINFQVALPNTNFGFGADQSTLVFDSVILSLSYKGVWGDSISPLAVHVYEMDPENLFTVDSAYNNTISFEKGNELTENNTAAIVSPNKLNDPDTLTQFSEDATNQLRIHLSSTFGNKLLHSYDSLNAYQNDSTFHNYIKGFIVEAEKQGNGLLRLNLSDTSTRLSLYYHISGVDSSGKVKRFATNALTCASSNTIIRNYSGAQIQNFYPPIANPNSQDSLLFIQTGPGTYAKIKIPGLDSLPNMIIHRAEILMQEVPDANDQTFSTPDLFIAAYSSDSNRRFAVPYDLQFSAGTFVNLTTFGVAPIPKTVGAQTVSTYSFDISRYV